MKHTVYCYKYTCQLNGELKAGCVEMRFTDAPVINTAQTLLNTEAATRKYIIDTIHANDKVTDLIVSLPFALREEELQKLTTNNDAGKSTTKKIRRT